MKRQQLFLILGVTLTAAACGPKQPDKPVLAPDRTLSESRAQKPTGSCNWVPSLPSDREDVCDRDHDGATLELVDREDMREQSATKSTYTCVCN